MRIGSEPSNIQTPDSAFSDEWLSENPLDSSIGGSGGDDGLRLATNSPEYTGPKSLTQKNDPYTISVDTEEDEENPSEESPPKAKTKGQNHYEVSAMQQKRRRRLVIVAATAVLVLLVVIIVSVVVSKNKKNNSSESVESVENPSDTNVTLPNATLTPTNQSEVVDTEDSFDFPYLGNRNGIVTYSTGAGPFTVEIPTLASSTVGVYQDEDEVRDGLSRMALFLMNNAVQRIVGSPGFSTVGFGAGGAGNDWYCDTDQEIAVPASDLNGGDKETSNSGVGNVDAYKTNNQEELVDQADVAKSDGIFIYAAYGSQLLILDPATGKLVLTLNLPSPECRNITFGCTGVNAPDDIEDNMTYDESTSPSNGTATDSEVIVTTMNSSEAPVIPTIPPPNDGGYFTYCPQVKIESILLDTNNSRLALVVSGYGDQLAVNENATTPILSDYLATQIRLYSTEPLLENGGGVGLLGVQNINGYYRQGYFMEDNGVAHIVTSSMLNSRHMVVKPLEELQAQMDAVDASNEAEFLKNVRVARSDIVGSFVNKTIAELSITTGCLPRIAPIRLPVHDTSDVRGFEQVLLGEGYANHMIQITSFNIGGDPVTAENNTIGEIEVSQTVQFLPNAYGEVYAEKDMMIITGTAYQFVDGLAASEDMTVLYAYALDDTTTSLFAIGKIPGHLLNRYSLDYHDGLFRAATTKQRWGVDEILSEGPTDNVTSFYDPGSVGGSDGAKNEINVRLLQIDGGGNFVFLSACPDVVENSTDDCFSNETLTICQEMSERGCSSVIYSIDTCPVALFCMDDLSESKCPLPSLNSTESCLNAENLQACVDLAIAGCEDIAILESCPYQFSCVSGEADLDSPTTSSTTTNQIFVLEPPRKGETEMTIVGNVTLGKPNEVFTAVRFFNSIAYAVTFLRTDPFYAISFQDDPRTPVVLGQLEISGFSSYMHSINNNNSMILAIGMETDDNGLETGMKLSLFDATNQTAPVEILNYVLSEGSDTWSGSSAQWDFLAFRYVYRTEEEGRIIVPVYYSDEVSGDFFDGFKVFSLSPAGIFPLFDISHNVDNVFIRRLNNISGQTPCTCGYLNDRSFVIGGDIITLKAQSARSHNLDSGAKLWGLNFAGPDFCCV
ncbi:secreted protein with beta-propeller domain [Nitzschia inconspicua]|uniref:Secreted protein with beta-propeller domain n=1 Tax=Nitzschia inconspicua TaxID=303405 RepID=A0A9K3L2Y0_9STRA|nr:secreted protein with beta-propeller domain [Nitzschia inconspicua]